MLSFKDVTCTIDGYQILEAVTFKVVPGEVVALVGSSGAGKSTVFRLLTGEFRPTQGHILLDDTALSDLSFNSIQQYRRQVGVVFQDFRLLPQKTASENISFALEVCGLESKVKQKVPALLELVGLSQKMNAFPKELSGGEQQRLAIARALIHDPKILIADEPTGNLDPKNAREISELFAKLNKENNLTILFATHDPNMLSHLQPRIIRLEDGKVKFDLYNCLPEEAFAGIF